jgi:hypothetical protein
MDFLPIVSVPYFVQPFFCRGKAPAHHPEGRKEYVGIRPRAALNIPELTLGKIIFLIFPLDKYTIRRYGIHKGSPGNEIY